MLAIENPKNHFIFALKTFEFTFGLNLQMKIKSYSSTTYKQKEKVWSDNAKGGMQAIISFGWNFRSQQQMQVVNCVRVVLKIVGTCKHMNTLDYRFERGFFLF
jgi:hypothetical protein